MCHKVLAVIEMLTTGCLTFLIRNHCIKYLQTQVVLFIIRRRSQAVLFVDI